MTSASGKCRAQNPKNCYRHGTGVNAAIKNQDINAFLDAKENENPATVENFNAIFGTPVETLSAEQIRRENFFLEQDLAPKFCDFSSNRTAYITIVGRATKNEDGSKEGTVRAATQIDRLTENRVDDTEFYFRKNGRDIQLFTDKNSTTPLNDSEIFDMFMTSRKAYKK